MVGILKLMFDLPSLLPDSSHVSSNPMNPTPVMKQHLIYSGSTDFHSYVYRNVSSVYYCRTTTTSVGNFTRCLVLADEEVILRTLDRSQINVPSEWKWCMLLQKVH